MTPDPFDMLRAYTSATEMQQELAAARITIAALRKELAEAQENYHLVNEAAAKVMAENERLLKAGDAMHKVIGYELRTSRHIYAWHDWNAAKEGRADA